MLIFTIAVAGGGLPGWADTAAATGGSAVLLLAAMQFSSGRAVWFPARWELLAATGVAVLAASMCGLGAYVPLILAATIACGDLERTRGFLKIGYAFFVFAATLGAIAAASGFGDMRVPAPGPADAGPALIVAVVGSAGAGLLGFEVRRRLVFVQIVLIAAGFFFASTYPSLSPAVAASAGLAMAVASLLATRRALISRRWFRWMFTFGLVALAATWGLRLSRIAVTDVAALLGLSHEQPTPWWRIAAVAACAMPALAAMVTLSGRMRYYGERRAPVRASGALAALAATTAGLLIQPAAPIGVALPLLVLLCGATGWADRPLAEAHALQLESHHGPLRVYLRAFGMRKLRSVGIAFGRSRETGGVAIMP